MQKVTLKGVVHPKMKIVTSWTMSFQADFRSSSDANLSFLMK